MERMLKKWMHFTNGLFAWGRCLVAAKSPRKLWIIGSNLGRTYDGNAKVVFEYLFEKYGKDVYYVIEKKNKNCIKDIEKVREQILYRGSIRCFFYAFQSKNVIVSHSLADVIPVWYRFKKFFGYHAIYMGHGIDGFKKSFSISEKENKKYQQFDLICAANEFEKELKEKEMKISDGRIVVTGYPNFDALYAKHETKENPRIVLLLFTWREYENRMKIQVKDFLRDCRLEQILKKYNLQLHVMLHSFSWELYHELKVEESQRICICSLETLVVDELRQASLLITDYSSVAWDFAFMEKPVIFYQFDLKQYLLKRGSYLDLRKELFGKAVYNLESLFYEFEQECQKSFEMPLCYKEKFRKYFEKRDNHNCARVEEAIWKMR